MIPEHFPLDQYFCLLDEQPEALVPVRTIRPGAGPRPLMFNPLAWFAWSGAPPPDMAVRIEGRDGMFETPWVAWIDDPGTRSVTPFWLGPEMAHRLVDKTPGALVGDDIAGRSLAILCDAQIVVVADHVERRRRQWAEWSRYYGDHFSRGYVALDGLIHPFHLGALRRYFRRKVSSGAYPLDVGREGGRYISFEEPVAAYFHRQLATMIGDVSHAAVSPSSSRVAIYQGGGDQEAHAGRSASEFSLHIALDAGPEADTPWVMSFTTPEGDVPVSQDLGDGLLFRGRTIRPRRERLPRGRTAISLQFEFVEAAR